MGDKTWKAAERAIAKYFPRGKRRGPDFKGEHGGKNDIISEGWSPEVKHSKRPTYGLMLEAVEQARTNRTQPGDIPVAIIHKEGTEYKRSLVVMYLEDFAGFFINDSEEQETN